jgi:hypothetical protein
VLAVLRFLLLPLKLGEAQIMIADPIPTLSGKSAQQTDVCFGPFRAGSPESATLSAKPSIANIRPDIAASLRIFPSS